MIDAIRVKKTFISKRNCVTGDGMYVTKVFNDEADYLRELDMVEKLSECNVCIPKMISRGNKTIVYEQINGTLYAHLAEKMEEIHAHALASWLVAYHNVTGVLREDVNLRNFIYSDDAKCYGLDFESKCEAGDINEDYGKIIAFCATYDPIFSAGKQNSCRLLINEFLATGGNYRTVVRAFCGEIERMVGRRGASELSVESAKLFISEVL